MLRTATLALAAIAAIAPSSDARHGPRRSDHGGGNPNNHHARLMKRQITNSADDVAGKSFDYVIVGGGLAGLVVASRLSEWSNQTVLVIEAGGDFSDVEERHDIPGMAYHNGLSSNSPYGWNYTTIEQSASGGVTKTMPLGRGLGGSGAVNGMFFGRASKIEYDAWGALNPDGDHKWNWDQMDKYIKKAEQLTMPPKDVIDQFSIPIDPAAHGHDGPLHVGWCNYIYPIVADWIPTWVNMGLPVHDHSGGVTHGVTITPSTINSAIGSRSDAGTAYLQPNADRPNLVVLTNHQGIKVLFNGSKDTDGNSIASGVRFQASATEPVFEVSANREVIVSGGTINSAKLLQLSGVGPYDVLKNFGIDTIVDLPVGFNFQEHVSFSMQWNTTDNIETWYELMANKDLAASMLDQWRDNKDGKWTYVNEAVGYVTAADMLGGEAGAAGFAGNVDIPSIVNFVAGRHALPANVQQGMTAQLKLQKEWLTTGDIGQHEIIFHLWGATATALAIQCALQHPFSRGTVFIGSNDPFAMPIINPDYFSVDHDAQIMNSAAEWVRRLAKTEPLSKTLLVERLPGAEVTGDEMITFFKKAAGTEFHPLGTCAMMPRADGGVVDTNLVVYGTKNVRVIDASVIPLQMSAHLMATTYGIGEYGADIIKESTLPKPVPATTSSTSANSESTTDGDSADSASATGTKASSQDGREGLSVAAKAGIGIGAAVGAIALLGAVIFFLCRRKKEPKADKNGWYANGQQHGQWQGAAYNSDTYPLNEQPAGFRGRPLSHGSVSTMATADLHAHRPPRAGAAF